MKNRPDGLLVVLQCIPLVSTIALTLYTATTLSVEVAIFVGVVGLLIGGGIDGILGLGLFSFHKWKENDRKTAQAFDRLHQEQQKTESTPRDC